MKVGQSVRQSQGSSGDVWAAGNNRVPGKALRRHLQVCGSCTGRPRTALLCSLDRSEVSGLLTGFTFFISYSIPQVLNECLTCARQERGLSRSKISVLTTFTIQRKMQTRNKHGSKMISGRMSAMRPCVGQRSREGCSKHSH